MLFSICQASHSQHPPPGHTLLSLFFSICQASHSQHPPPGHTLLSLLFSILHLVTLLSLFFSICQASHSQHPPPGHTPPGHTLLSLLFSILHLVTHCCPCSSASSTWSHTAVPALQFFSICQASHHLSGIPQSQHPPPESASSTWSRSVDTAAGSPGSLLGVAAAACA
eukprot:TRINITY_DN17576_c0_g1_i6.p2 TRINITY_DN17576_c0_g1~~TRINITY_DN17576_c0_g1_i6.p2  ORF type:complete len:168 (+),score=40.88 TRINITY_DN17576_c0_g1_i6:73-576(+)